MADIRFDTDSRLYIRNVGYVNVVRQKEFVYRYKQGKNRFSFIFAKSGSLKYTFYTLNKEIILEEGQIIFVPESLPYETKYLQDGTEIQILVFRADVPVPGYLSAPAILNSSGFRSLVSSSPYDELLLYARVYELLHLLKENTENVPKKYRFILPAVIKLRQEYYENHPVSYYAALCIMSETNFRRLFKEYTGRSPIEYRNALRIAEAEKLTEIGELSAVEIAEKVGFNNMAFFYESYRKYSGNKSLQ